MFEKKEKIAIGISVIIMTLMILFGKNESSFAVLIRALLVSLIIILFVVIAKKITASKLDVEIENKTWEFQRYGIAEHSHFKKPVQIGLLLPLIISFLSLGFIKLFMFLQFESKALPTKVVKRFGLRRLSGIMDWDDALIVFYSLVPLLLVAVIAKFFTGIFFSDLARYSWIYVVCNLLPISKLDGTKLFFGSMPLFVFTWVITLLTWPIVF